MGSDEHLAILLCMVFFFASPGVAQAPNNSGSLHGEVVDPSGAVVVGATVSVTASGGQAQKVPSDKLGKYIVRALPAGNVTVNASASGFTSYQMPNVIIPAGGAQQLDITLGIAVQQEQVTVQSEAATVDVNPANNASATVLKGTDLEGLSDDPDDLQQDLLALAGPSAGPKGGQIFVDGFSDGTLPPKSSIREIRINQNPFSAEYDESGYDRVEVFTKPGSDKWHGQFIFNENNSEFNARNPYINIGIPEYHSEIYTGNISGALGKEVSVFFNGEHRNIDNVDAVAATSVEPSNVLPSPLTRTNISSRMDWQAAAGNTLTARYQFLTNDQQNLGTGGTSLTSLQSQAYNSRETQHLVQLIDTQVLSPHVINETRFQYIHDNTSQVANQSGAELYVLGEFTAGGNTIVQNSGIINRYELQNYTSWSAGKHFMKFGGRLRAYHDNNYANNNKNGTLIYTSFQDYENGTPAQLSIVTVNDPHLSFSFADVGVYAEDDWKLRPNLTFSYGLRYEAQSGIRDKKDFAPRFNLSWGLGSANGTPKTVLRVGYGIFYDRFTYDLLEEAQRLNGERELTTIYSATSTAPITCPAGTAPPTTTLASQCNTTSVPLSLTLYQVNPNLRAAYYMQSAVSLERQLGRAGTVSFTYLNLRGLHQYNQVNTNAPDPALGGVRPLSARYGDDNIYQFYSEGIFKINQWIANVQIHLSQKLSLNGYYVLGYAKSDIGEATSNPVNQYRLTDDYGRASFDIRNRVFLSGSASLAQNIRLSPIVVIRSGAPFNITTGYDNGDSFFNQRPTFAPLQNSVCAAPYVSTQYGCFNVTPAPSDRPIPSNFGKGPNNVTVNLRLSKAFGFGKETKPPAASDHGSGRLLAKIFAPSSSERQYNLTFAMTARNLLNTWNPGSPIGDLTSGIFGKTTGLAGGAFSSSSATSANRRIDFQVLFSF